MTELHLRGALPPSAHPVARPGRPTVARTGIRSATLSTGARSPVARLAGELMASLPEMAEQLAQRIRAADEHYRRFDEAELATQVQENLRHALEHLADDRPPGDEAPRRTAARRAEEGLPLGSVLQAFRLGFGIIWEAMAERALRSGEHELHELVRGATAVWAIVDKHSEAVTATYRDTLIEAARREEQQRTLLVDALFSGRLAEWQLLSGSLRMLGLPARGPFLAVSAECPVAGTEGVPGVERTLRRVGVRSCWRLRPDEQVGLIALGPQPVGVVREVLASVARGRVGVSLEFADAAGTSGQLAAAATARRALEPGAVAVADPDDDPLATLLASAPEMSDRVARTLLRGVIDLPVRDRALLLTTLRTWFAARGHTAIAARELFCHRNTVRNRLRRVEQLTGRSLEDPRAMAELVIAVETCRLLSPDLLTG